MFFALIGIPVVSLFKNLLTLHDFIIVLKVIAATNRVDILDPALLRSGRLDRKIEFPHPNEEARARILQIHSRKMNVRYESDQHFAHALTKCCLYLNY